MASVKRKAVTDDRPSKKAKPAEEKKEKKDKPRESKNGSKETKPKKSHAASEAGEKRPPAKSVLQQEERAFPRGGGSVLTPLEHKQIKAQAERDVLFEQENGEVAEEKADDTLFDEGKSAAKKKKRKDGRKSGDEPGKVEGSGVRIQGLSYKSLVVGSMVLGRVTGITGRDIALALPNNLTGYAQITAVSESLNARIERLLQDDGKPDDSGHDAEDIDLKQLFHVGQWLRAVVTSTGSESADGGKKKRHIELTLDPGQVNGGLAEDKFVVNSTIQASVRSVEDHGIVMDLGLSDASVKGFISKKELGSAYNIIQISEGQVMLCLVTGKGSNGKVLKLCPDTNKFAVNLASNKLPIVSEAPTVDAFQPGTAVDILVTDCDGRGVVGKIMGMLNVTADVFHSGAYASEDMAEKHKIGSKTKARIIYSLPQDDGSRRVGVSILDHMLALLPPPGKLAENSTSKIRAQAADLDQKLTLSATVETAKVVRISAERGLFLTLPMPGNHEQPAAAFAHISQVSDSRIDSISTTGPYKVDSTHKARIIAYNPVDNVYYVSLKKSTLDQAFLRLEDLTVGSIVKGTVDKLILGGKKGVTGVLVKLSDSISGLVPEMHLSDTQLSHPERKYREGFPVKARVLSVDTDKRHIRLTLKKSLVEADDSSSIWKDYDNLTPGMESQGTIINLLPAGAAVQFYGPVRAWLPVAEMSETFIEKTENHFRLGQTVRVKILSVNPAAREMKVTCKSGGELTAEQQTAWEEVSGGDLVSGVVSVKGADNVSVDLSNGLKGVIKVEHLVDASAAKAESALKRIRVGQTLSNLLVLEKLDRSQTVALSNKPALVEDAKNGTLIKSFEDAQEGRKVHGFVRNITPTGVYVEFASGIVGLLPKSQIVPEAATKPDFGLRKDQTLSLRVSGIDSLQERFILSMREGTAAEVQPSKAKVTDDLDAANPIDSKIKSMADFSLGKVVKAKVVSVKATQANVRLADNVQGRIDVSEAFDSWKDITNKAAPLEKFKPNDVVEVKILGIHDARNHRFLPISHRAGKVPVFELSAKRSRIDAGDESLLSFDTVKKGSSCLAFVNNHDDSCVWVNLSPNVRGRVALMDLSDDVGQLQNVENRFRIGCALKVTVKAIDLSSNRLDLTAREATISGPLTLQDLKPGMVLPARVTKVNERSVFVEIADNLAGPVPLVELSDDYEQVNTAQYNKNDIVRVCVLGVDLPNKRAFLSMRPSKVLSSSLPVKDPHVNDVSQLKVGDVVRGFVKQVADKGVFVTLGARTDALVRISDLSDQYIKDWQSVFEIDQLVKGRVLAVDVSSKQVRLSLKNSHVDKNYTPPLNINDIEVGMTVVGKVRKVEDFGAFIDIDNTRPRLSGLCHRSEVAAKRIEDVRTLYSAGDVVKARVLDVDVEKRKISLGLKASYFNNTAEDEESEEDSDAEMGGVDVEDADEESDSDGGIDLSNVQDIESEEEFSDADGMEVDDEPAVKLTAGLKTNGFDWTGDALDTDKGAASESEHEGPAPKKRKSKKAEIKVDLTGDLDKYGPRSVSDFERQLLGQPNNSDLWIQYMAFQLQLSEIQKARDIAERALRTIHIRETEEKANVWIAWLNLEVEYGDEDRMEEVFKQACQVQDPLEMHEKMASIYIDSGKHDKADATFERMVGNKTFRASPDVWLNYATFLLDTLQAPARARALLSKALQSVPTREHRLLTAKFAALEFRSQHGDAERGRTIFEGLVSEYPKWSSGWDMWLDIERARVAHAENAEAKKDAIVKTRALFERISKTKMKKRRAKFTFKKWLEFEEKEAGEKEVEKVKKMAKEFVERLQAAGGDDGDE
ncbi:rRNA biogenesis protein RRP5 [Zymoseptoria brevis]|uniref:rRNA biogenesis protein RRP5 n=1 Tax=Zymoseptoria brevis TaxID=1047168 RepID=A0A0F4GPE5_9PEZI|nr:rRNA biogenesis protein RRP5 [Zymoseptoria brevis]